MHPVDYVHLEGNVLVGNRSGIYIDNSPTLPDVTNTVTGNYLAYNDIGISALPAVSRNIFQSNSFLDNTQQVSVLGRGDLLRNTWQKDGTGNYWSDYIGYDASGDGIGDIPYRFEKLFESLIDEYPSLRLFIHSPASQSINFAAAAFPSLRPVPRVIDDAPLIELFIPSHLTASDRTMSTSFLLVSLVLLGIGGGLCLFTLHPPGKHNRRNLSPAHGKKRSLQ